MHIYFSTRYYSSENTVIQSKNAYFYQNLKFGMFKMNSVVQFHCHDYRQAPFETKLIKQAY